MLLVCVCRTLRDFSKVHNRRLDRPSGKATRSGLVGSTSWGGISGNNQGKMNGVSQVDGLSLGSHLCLQAVYREGLTKE